LFFLFIFLEVFSLSVAKMKSYSPLAVLALAAAVNAQSAPGFPVQVNTELAVDFQSSSESFIDPGQKLSLDGTSENPRKTFLATIPS
jgi:hypothetical protein